MSTVERPPLLRVERLAKRYGETQAVDHISFDVVEAEVFTLLGPNGAGKTTTLEILEGLREPDSGTLEIFGRTISTIDRRTKERMGVLLQEGNFEPYLKVREVIRLIASFFPKARPVDEVLASVALEEKAGAHVRTLSGGQKQRLAIGAALVNNPDLVFLDEPTTGLDPQARRNIWDIVSTLTQAGKTVILTTHYMEEAESLSDAICIMDHGRIIAQGTPRELTASLGQETFIEFPAPGVDPEQLARLEACCDRIREHDGMVSLETQDLLPTMDRLLDWSRELGVPMADMSVRQPNLEDVFLSLTGRGLRE